MNKTIEALKWYMEKANRNGLRIGQLFDNVFAVLNEKGIDPFYLSDNAMLVAFEDYTNKYLQK